MDTGISSNLSVSTINEIKSLGANENLEISPKSSYLLLGKKGSSQGSRPVIPLFFKNF